MRARGGLPARLAELLTARVSDCGAQAWAALAAMSVAGRALTEDQLTDVTGLDAEALRAGLRELESRSLAETAAGGRHRARHALLAEAAAARLLPGERRGLHERLAAVLQAGGEALAPRPPITGRPRAGVRRSSGPGSPRPEAAERVFGYAEAAAHWQRAIELDQGDAGADLPGWYVRAIDARHLAGDAEGAGVLAEEACRRFAGHPDPAIAAVVRERAARFRGIGDVFLGGPSAPARASRSSPRRSRCSTRHRRRPSTPRRCSTTATTCSPAKATTRKASAPSAAAWPSPKRPGPPP